MKEDQDQLHEIKKSLLELGFTEEEIAKALTSQETDASDDLKKSLENEIEELEKSLNEKKEALKTMDKKDTPESESIDDEEDDEDKEDEDEEKMEKEDLKKSLEELITEKFNQFDQSEIIKSLQDKLEDFEQKFEKISKSFVDRRPLGHYAYIEKGDVENEDGTKNISISQNKGDILKAFEEVMEKAEGVEKDYLGRELVKFNTSSSCDPKALLKVASQKNWKLIN